MGSFPISYLLFSGLWFNVPLRNYPALLTSPWFYMASFWSVLAGYGLWEMRRWAWYIFLVAHAALFYQNALVVIHYSAAQYQAAAFFLAAFLQLAIVFKITREVRVPYFLPKIRWWASSFQENPTLETSIRRKDGTEAIGEILDVSVFGCFVKIQNTFDDNESVTLRFSVKGEEFECQGCVVWRTEPAVTHPKGIGIKFEKMNRRMRKNLRSVIHGYKKEANQAYFESLT